MEGLNCMFGCTFICCSACSVTLHVAPRVVGDIGGTQTIRLRCDNFCSMSILHTVLQLSHGADRCATHSTVVPAEGPTTRSGHTGHNNVLVADDIRAMGFGFEV